jgi:hypothetical protein
MAIAEQSVFIKGEPVDEAGLKAIIAMEMENALGIDGGKLSIQRRDALKQYEGEPYGNEVDGRSQVVDRTIMETVEWIMPALMRIFTSSDQIVEVEPQLPQDEEAAQQMTAYVNYIFTRENPGFMLLYTWFKDALLQKLGWIDAYWDIERRTEDEKFSGLTEEQYQALSQDPDLEEIECVAYPAFAPVQGLIHQQATRQGAQPLAEGRELSPLMPSPLSSLAKMQPGSPTVYDCTFRRTYNEGRVKLVNKPPEEVLISRRATRDSVPFLCERTRRTRSELIEAGFDYDTVMTLSPFDEQEYNTERIQRFFKNDEWPYRSSRTDPAMIEVWVNVCYLKVDMEGDGIAKLRKVTVGGDKTYTILGNELWDEITLHSTTPIPQPHTLVGLSLADLVSDLQLIKTTLWRQTLDNLYLANNPRTYVNENAVTENTYDDLLTSRPGGLIRGNGPANDAVFPFTTPFVGQATMQMLSYIDESGQKRTGISKGNQGIAPDDLNKNAAIGSQGVGMLQEAAAQRVELIARIFAEDVKKLCRGILGLVIRNQQGTRTVRIAGRWTPIDPALWKKQFNLNVTVGLGTGNRDKMVGQIQQIIALQMQAVQLQKGITGPLVTGEHLFNSACALAEAMGFKNALKFVGDPKNAPPQPPPQPDPLVQAAQVKAQAEAQASQAEAQAKAQQSAAELAMREKLGIAEVQMKFQVEMARLGIEGKRFELDEATTRAELGLKADEHEMKKRTTPGAQVMRKHHAVHRDPVTGLITGATTTEIPEPAPGSLPEGPQLGA